MEEMDAKWKIENVEIVMKMVNIVYEPQNMIFGIVNIIWKMLTNKLSFVISFGCR